MADDELEHLLRKILATTGADALRLTQSPGILGDYGLRAKLSARVALVAEYTQPERGDQRPSRRELVERAARELRAWHRTRGDATPWPERVFPNASAATNDPKRLILARIQQFLGALVDCTPFHQYVIMLRGRLIASATPLDKDEEAQLDLVFRQVEKAGDAALGTTHGELVREGLFAKGFWYHAALIGFCHGEYSADFIRHQSKMVTRELATLVAMLDGDPDEPVKEAPPP